MASPGDQAHWFRKLGRSAKKHWLFIRLYALWLKYSQRKPTAVRAIAARIRGLEQQAAAAHDIGFYVINLDESPERLSRISILAAPRPLRRIAGVPGRYLPDGSMKRFGRQVTSGFKGTLGCFLSHYSAWETHLKAAEPFALILEDDCVPLIALPASASSLMLPGDFDICFLTTGLEPVSGADTGRGEASLFQPLEQSVARAASHLVAPGAYGYVVSRRGAEKLIARVDEDGFYGDVDWRMLAYCLPVNAIDSYPRDSFAFAALAAHHRVMAQRPPLSGYCCGPGLIRPGRIGSVRERDNDRRHAHLWLETSP